MRRWAAAVALAIVFCLNALWYSPYLVDDAFISLRYARNLAAGRGLVYNPGEQVEGFSNFLWVLLEAGLLALGLPVVSSIQILGGAAGLGVVLLTLVLARRVLEGGLAPTIAGAFVALNTSLALWSVAGLETSLLALLLVAAVLRYEVEGERADARPWSATLFALAWLTRPEAPAYLLYFLVRRRPPRAWCVWLAALVVPYELFGYLYFGHLFPATHAAKVGGGWPFTAAGLVEFAGGQGWATPALLVTAALGCLVGWRRLPAAAWVPTACGVLFVAYAGVDWMPRFRFFVPFLPFLALAVAYGLVELGARARRSTPLRWTCWVGVAVLFAGYAEHQLTGSYRRGARAPGPVGAARGFWPAELGQRVGTREWPQEQPARWLLENVPDGEAVALADIGFPGYLTDNPVWDLRGLVTPAAAARRHDQTEAARERMLASLRAADPACIVIPSLARDPESFMGRLDRDLQTAPWLARRFRRNVDEAARAVIYLRKDLGRPDVRARRAAARARVPELGE
jgi:hypothetical protein